MKALIPDEPRAVDIHAGLHALCRQPAEQGMMDNRGGMADAALILADGGSNKPLRCKKRHLRVIGDRAHPTGMRGQILQPFREAIPDPRQVPELDLGSESIAYRPAEEASVNLVLRNGH